MKKMIYTLLIGILGGIIGIILNIPAGAMIGSMVFVGIYNVKTNNAYVEKKLKFVGQIIIGCIVGLNFNMEAVIGLKELIFPAIILIVGLTGMCILLGYILYKVTNIDLTTALFSCAPGGLTDMTLMSEAYGAQIHIVAILHLIRLTTVLTIFPIVIKIFIY